MLKLKKVGGRKIFPARGGCLFGGLGGGLAEGREGGMRSKYKKILQNWWKNPQNSIEQVFFSSFLLQTMPPASVALRSQVFPHKIGQKKASSCSRIAIKSPERLNGRIK